MDLPTSARRNPILLSWARPRRGKAVSGSILMDRYGPHLGTDGESIEAKEYAGATINDPD